VIFFDESVWAQDDLVQDAFFLSIVVDREVSKDTERKLGNFLVLVLEDALDVATVKDFTELLDQTDIK